MGMDSEAVAVACSLLQLYTQKQVVKRCAHHFVQAERALSKLLQT